MEGLSLLSLVATCLDLAQTIDSAVQKVRGARSELDEGLQVISSTRKLLSQFRDMFEASHLPQELLEGYMRDMQPLQFELENIQGSLNSYVRSSTQKGFASSLAWRIRWGRQADKHQRNLKNLNGSLNQTIGALNLRVSFLALEIMQIGRTPTSLPLCSETAPKSTSAVKSLSDIGKEYAQAARELQDKEWQNIPIAHIQQSYFAAAKAFQIEELNRPQFCSSAFAITVNGPKMNLCMEKV